MEAYNINLIRSKWAISVHMVLLFLFVVGCSNDKADQVYSGSWRTEFEYNDRNLAVHGMASGATAVAENGKVLAKAKLLDLLTREGNSLSGVEVEETHFDMKGNVKYRCKSQFDIIGRKTGETDKKGIKHTDYFTQWPTIRMPMGSRW